MHLKGYKYGPKYSNPYNAYHSNRSTVDLKDFQNHFLDCPRSSCSPWFPFGVRFESLFGPLYLNWETLNAICFNVNLITLETLDLVSGSQHQSNRKRDRPDPRVRFKNPFAYINTPSRATNVILVLMQRIITVYMLDTKTLVTL